MVQLRFTGLDDQKLLSWYGFHEEHDLKDVFPLFQDCYQSITERPVSEIKLLIN